jgi:gamma-glutamyl phosphate reductase
MSDLLQRVTALAQAAKKASRALALAPTAVRDQALRAAAAALRTDEAAILSANAEDLALARAKGLTEAMIDRLRLDPARLEAIAVACEDVAKLPAAHAWCMRYLALCCMLRVLSSMHERNPHMRTHYTQHTHARMHAQARGRAH